MPVKYRRKTQKSKRKYRKNNPSKGLTTRPSTMPDQYHTTLKYGDVINETATTTAGHDVWRGNSLFDPDLTFTGHRPLGMDQFEAFYKQYYVIGSSIKLTIANHGNAIIALTLRPSSQTAGGSGICGLIEKPRTKKIIMPPLGNSAKQLSSSMTTLKQLGLAKSEYMSDHLSSVVGANPSTEWFWHLQWQHPDEVTQVDFAGFFEITYNVVFFDRVRLDQSA